MANARGGSKLVTCCDRACCLHGMTDTIDDPRQHAAYQSFSMMADMTSVPDLKREQHFLNGRMADVDRKAQQAKKLKLSAEEAIELEADIGKLTKRVADHSKRIGQMFRSLEVLHEARADGAPRTRPVAARGTKSGQGNVVSK